MDLERRKVFEQMTEASVRSEAVELAKPDPSYLTLLPFRGAQPVDKPKAIMYSFLQNIL